MNRWAAGFPQIPQCVFFIFFNSMCSLTKCVILSALLLHRLITATADNYLGKKQQRRKLNIAPEDANSGSSGRIRANIPVFSSVLILQHSSLFLPRFDLVGQ